ncbi:ABC transporter ATP-binding protein [Variovorax saccharolyticus]|uniref:ABC transporter ATP-binding protein n=1 Tax=Variovorax saccharolyticus TaxID=3053516 RepID=UPI0025763737|nr:ABC transporter ATP-binding protein [Variovorax sp. J22R187]MDM0021864.1 ABC transporter ATP-binding protein [Variovorax sp. J22R187]
MKEPIAENRPSIRIGRPSPQDEALLSVSGLNAYYGKAHILFDLALDVRPGEVVVLMGRNGAGKSTTMKSIMNMMDRKEGALCFAGRDISSLPPYRISQAGLGYVPEDRRIFTELTVLENLEVGRQPARAGMPPWSHDRLFEMFPNLGEMPGRLGGRMSGGEQQMLSIARTLMGNPSLVLLDEPSEGIAPVIVEKIALTIQRLKKQGVSILLSEQNITFAEWVGDRAYVLEKGHIRFEGSMKDLVRNEEVRSAYLDL